MKLIRVFALLVVVFYLAQENETDALVAKAIEGGAYMAINAGLKIIKIPIMIGGKIAWKCVKVSSKFVFSLAKIPFNIILRLAWKFSRKPLKLLTPKFIQDTIREHVTKYKLNKKLRKQRKSKVYRFKTEVKNKIRNWKNNRKLRKIKQGHNVNQ